MISVLIPVYNFEIFPLVHELHKQCEQSNLSFEIICLDDNSSEKFKLKNQEVKFLSNVVYLELKENIGRSAIRNKLASIARFDWLIFMDCDTFPPQQNYIQNYLKQCNNSFNVVFGGRAHYNEVPTDSTYLRWIYGVKRESKKAAERNLNPYISFMTNNFLVHKKILSKVKFDESLKTYGHEDTLFAQELKKIGIGIIHIDNPLVHLGLESSEEFIEKTELAIINLCALVKRKLIGNEVKLVKVYFQLKDYHLTGLLSIISNLVLPTLKKRLCGNKPSLFCFDLYKLMVIIRQMN